MFGNNQLATVSGINLQCMCQDQWYSNFFVYVTNRWSTQKGIHEYLGVPSATLQPASRCPRSGPWIIPWIAPSSFQEFKFEIATAMRFREAISWASLSAPSCGCSHRIMLEVLHHAAASVSAALRSHVGSTAETKRLPGAGVDCATLKSSAITLFAFLEACASNFPNCLAGVVIPLLMWEI